MTDIAGTGLPRATRSLTPPSIQSSVVAVAGALILLGVIALDETISARQAALFGVGGLLGLALYHASFGFTAAWRAFLSEGNGTGLRAQMLMLAIAVVLFFPALAEGSLFGHEVSPNLAPLGISLLVGAVLFGIGMQIGGGCASGTLFTVGGGSTKMLLTLAFFVIGSGLGTAHFAWWQALPKLPPVSLLSSFGLWPALALNLVLFAAIAGLTLLRERGSAPSAAPRQSWISRLWRGSWPAAAGAVALALLNFATLALSGRPWGITSAFGLWGAKLAALVGLRPETWPYWQGARAHELVDSVFGDVTSVMDFGIVLGALLAAGLAGKFAPAARIAWRPALGAVIGGLLLGYGARLAYGCNIGAYFSGIASASLHGWVWLVAAFLGNAIGIRLRPLFGLASPPSAAEAKC
jgi:uncharacterized protein